MATLSRTQDADREAREIAEKKLQLIIDRYGDQDGERRKPYYLQQLIEEAKRAIAWRMFSLDLMALMAAGNDNAPQPTKAHGAL